MSGCKPFIYTYSIAFFCVLAPHFDLSEVAARSVSTQQSKHSERALHIPSTCNFRFCFGKTGMSLVRIYSRASWCSTRFSVRFREGSGPGPWAMLYRFSGVLSIGINVQSKSCREATCMHFELSVPTVLHARKACAHIKTFSFSKIRMT